MAALFLAAVSPAAAHAILLKSSPAPNSIVAGPDVSLQLQFNSRVDGKRSRVTMSGSANDHYQVDLTQPNADSLTSKIAGLKPGLYHVLWQVLAADGHISRGEFVFTVK